MHHQNTFGRFRSPAAALLTLALGGCAATIDQSGLEERTASAVGRPVGAFTIADRSEETGGRINYTVKTRDGSTFKCYLYSATSFQKVMSFGQTPNSDAICSAMGRGGAPSGAATKPASTCNALLKAAGKC
jgi:hypothetical protein